MPRWTFEPGHTAPNLRPTHMMVISAWPFQDVHGTLDSIDGPAARR